MPYDVLLRRRRDRVDSVELVDLDDGEVVLFWDATPKQARRMAEALRADARRLPADELLARWASAEPRAFG